MQKFKNIVCWALLALFVGGTTAGIGSALSGVSFSGQAAPNQSFVEDFGWSEPAIIERSLLSDRILLRDIPAEWQGAGEGKEKYLHRDYEAVTGKQYVPRHQGNSPSCVGQAASAAVDFLAAAQIHSLGRPEKMPDFYVDAAVTYGLSRQEIGQAGPMAGGGSHNLWASQALQQYGVVFMQDYPLLGIDLSEEDPARCVEYGRDGCPDALEPLTRLHPVKDYIQISSYEDLRDAIYAGCPVIIGSKTGFGKGSYTRDRDGFLRSKWWSTWRHSMVVIGVDDSGRRPGVLFLNSWGDNWVDGPKHVEDAPEGSFFVDAATVDKMVKQGDSYALRGYVGTIDYSFLSK